MGIYQTNEGWFLLPEGWHDQSVTIFTNAPEAPRDFSFVISREQISGADLLPDWAARQLGQLRERLPEFELLSRSDAEISGLPAVEVQFLWTNEGMRMRQHQFYLFVNWTALTATATAAESVYPRYEDAVRRTMHSFNVR